MSAGQPPPPPPPPPPGQQPPPGQPPPPPQPLRPPPPYVGPAELRPSRVWYWVAGGIAVVSVIVSIVLFVSFFSGLVDDLTGPLTDLQAPGEATLQLEADAERTIYRQTRDSGSPAPGASAEDPTCTVTGPGGATVEVSDAFEWTLERDDDKYKAIYDFSASEAGAYRIACESRGAGAQPVNLAIGEKIKLIELLTQAGVALLVFFGGLGIAAAIAIATAVMRDNHKRRLQREALARQSAEGG